MKQLSMREFNSNISSHLNNLPIILTKRGTKVATIREYRDEDDTEVATKPYTMKMNPEDASRMETCKKHGNSLKLTCGCK